MRRQKKVAIAACNMRIPVAAVDMMTTLEAIVMYLSVKNRHSVVDFMICISLFKKEN